MSSDIALVGCLQAQDRGHRRGLRGWVTALRWNHQRDLSENRIPKPAIETSTLIVPVHLCIEGDGQRPRVENFDPVWVCRAVINKGLSW